MARHKIARLNTDGTLDVTFDPREGSDGEVSPGGLLRQPDGKLIIIGMFFNIGDVVRYSGMARLNTDGTLDPAFDPGGKLSYDGLDDRQGNAMSPGRVSATVLQSDGKIVVTGNFTM